MRVPCATGKRSASAHGTRVVVSLSTLPSRDCTKAVASLLGQSHIPDAIYISVSAANASLAKLWESRHPHVVRPIVRLNDRGPAEKYLVGLEIESNAPGTIFVVLDDDWIYPRRLIGSLLTALRRREWHSSAPHLIAVGGSGGVLPHNLSRSFGRPPSAPPSNYATPDLVRPSWHIRCRTAAHCALIYCKDSLASPSVDAQSISTACALLLAVRLA